MKVDDMIGIDNVQWTILIQKKHDHVNDIDNMDAIKHMDEI